MHGDLFGKKPHRTAGTRGLAFYVPRRRGVKPRSEGRGIGIEILVLIGLGGIIPLAHVIAIPADEIVLPALFLLTVLTTRSTGVGGGTVVILEFES